MHLESKNIFFKLLSVSILTGFIFCTTAFSATGSLLRPVSLEWEKIPSAKSYEINFQELKANTETPSGKEKKFKSTSEAWNGQLKVGKYFFMIRSVDYRGVPGEWSPPTVIDVPFEEVKITEPSNGAEIAMEDDEIKLTLHWTPVNGLSQYKVEITQEPQDPKLKPEVHLVEGTELQTTLSAVGKYSIKVQAIVPDGVPLTSFAQSTFTVLGAPIAKVRIEAPANEFVRTLTWKPQPGAKSYDVVILRQIPGTNDWQEISKSENITDTRVPFKAQWPGGQYKVQVTGKAPFRKKSESAQQEFAVKDGPRTQQAEMKSVIRRGIERESGWYGIASYLIAQINYTGINYETNSGTSFEALGGTGRVGAGYSKSPSPWGFLGIVDASGFEYNSSNHSFMSTEGSVTYQVPYSLSDIRLQAGVFIKELPHIFGETTTGSVYDSKITNTGLQAGSEFRYPLTPKLGLQANLHAYYSLLGLSTPNGLAQVPTLSYQVGLMGSYKLNSRMTGFIGYAYRSDVASYKAKTGDTASLAQDGDIDSTEVAGNYLNLFLEWTL